MWSYMVHFWCNWIIITFTYCMFLLETLINNKNETIRVYLSWRIWNLWDDLEIIPNDSTEWLNWSWKDLDLMEDIKSKFWMAPNEMHLKIIIMIREIAENVTNIRNSLQNWLNPNKCNNLIIINFKLRYKSFCPK